jgi:hypothetical protein
MLTELLNINNLVDFVVIQLVSKKTNKTYYAIALKLNNQYYILKFLTESQKSDILK